MSLHKRVVGIGGGAFHLYHDQFFARWIILDCKIGFTTEEIGLVELDQTVQADLLWPVLG